MSIRIGICDDNQEDIRVLTKALYDYDATLQISAFKCGEALIENWLEYNTIYDILFLDIYMPKQSGIEVANKIREKMKYTKIIFISSSKDHYSDAYDVFAFNYLLKPLNLNKLKLVLEQALNDISQERREHITISYKGKNFRIFCRDIQYMESKDKLISFHLANKAILQCYGQLDDLLEKLPKESFIRCHQSFCVNIYYISEMGDKHFRVDPVVIGISKKYLKSAKEKYFAYLFTNLNQRGM
ncbi:MAG: LytTR family DNA-binding domain-containing protein [Clostridia bacterium]